MEISDRLGLHKVIGRMVDGYETRIEHAANSGLPMGIRQKIALVRALTIIERPKLLLFDEANAHLDRASDGLLREMLEQYRGDCSMVVVSHRPSYLGMADRLCILHGGFLQDANETNSVHDSLQQIERKFGA
jgi:ABC-type protease/lipase transport system fused ATPase/permease subunit